MSSDPRATLAEAGVLHRSGRIEQAIDAYRRAAKLMPGSFDAQHMLAVAQLQAGRLKDAAQSARRACEVAPRNPRGHLVLGAALLAAGQPDRAFAAFDRAAQLAPDFLEAHFQAGNALAALERYDDAVARYDRALALDPRSVEALTNRAIALGRLGRHQEALADCDRLLEMQPWAPVHHLNKGQILLEQGEAPAAAAAARAALALQKGLAAGHFLLGQALLGTGDFAGAATALQEAARLEPARPENHVRLAHALRLGERLPEAEAAAAAALALHPRSATALYERGEARRLQGKASAALADADMAVKLAPDFAAAHLLRAGALYDQAQHADYRTALDRALRIDGSDPVGLFARATDDLAHGRWSAGWAGYEQRERLSRRPFTALPFPRWDGQERPETLVVLGEQGIGDILHFARLLPLLADRGIDVRLLTRPRLAPLLAWIEPRVAIVADLSGIDTAAPGLRWVPLGSLPHVLEPDPAHWPPVPYLRPDAEHLARWAHVREGAAFTVGINWQGSSSSVLDLGRSIPLAEFAPLAEVEGVRLVSLQFGPGIEQLDAVPFGDRIARLPAGLDRDGMFLDTAAVLAHLDCIVTIDSALAHLAGAMGRPGHVALRAAPDWRWGLEGEHSVLYPSLRLVRQSRAGAWGDVLARIAGRLRATDRPA